MDRSSITYRQLCQQQRKDLKTKTSRNMIYRKFSGPFTYVFLKTGWTPYGVSILNFFLPIIGMFLISTGIFSYMILGLSLFILFKILDCTDGELARLLNPRAMEGKHKIIEGVYFDAIGHFIFPICLGFGMGMALFSIIGHIFFIYMGFLLALLLTLEVAAINELVRTYFRKGVIERKLVGKVDDKVDHEKLMKIMNENAYRKRIGFAGRIFGIHPNQGLFYSLEFIVPLMLIFVTADFFLLSHVMELFSISMGATLLYQFILLIVKSARLSIFIYRMKKYLFITKYLEMLGRR